MSYTEDDTYDALVAKQVEGIMTASTFVTTGQKIYHYHYQLDGVKKVVNFCEADVPPRHRFEQGKVLQIGAIATPSGKVTLL